MAGNAFTMRRHALLPLLLAVLMLGFAAGCDSDDDDDNGGNGGNPNTNEVRIQNNAFSPATITVSPGTTVTWANLDGTAHTVTAGTPDNPSGAFDSGSLAANATFTHTFTTAGSFPYFCEIHPGMRGTVVVQ